MDSKIKRLAILGSTGSIGQQALQVIRQFPEKFQVIALAAGKNLDLLEKQAAEFKPRYVYYDRLLPTKPPVFQADFLNMEEMSVLPEIESVLVATSGKSGLMATLAAVKAGKQIAIANKEPLVMAGSIITREARYNKAVIMPVDSEHSAIRQCLEGEKSRPLTIILTASGGPFRQFSRKRMSAVTAAEALRHPSWKMGKKVTIDSATLMNKGLEVIEAHWLFGVPFENIKIIVHPQSIIHSMVEFADGSVKAQLSNPDMRLPIQYALSYPDRLANPELSFINWDSPGRLTFEPPDFKKFPCLNLAIEAGKAGGTMPAVLCGADEICVELFLKGRIKLTDIDKLIADTLDAHRSVSDPGIEDILFADKWARDFINKAVRIR